MIFRRKPRAPKWYDGWREAAFDELRAQQAELSKTFSMGAWPRFDYDLDAAALTFSDESGPRVVADIQVVGTVGSKDWLWGWANPHFPKVCTADMDRVRAYGEEHGIPDLTSEVLEAENLEGLGWMMTAVSARLLAAAGAYRAPTKNGPVFFALRSVGWVT